MGNSDTRRLAMEFEQKAQELVHAMFILSEKQLSFTHEKITPTSAALTNAALALQNAINTFLAIERTFR